MAPNAFRSSESIRLPPKQRTIRLADRVKKIIRSSASLVSNLLLNPLYFGPASIPFLIVEVALSLVIIQRVQYTEIDWTAYIEQVQGFVINKSLDYTSLAGGTGPLVYPAGHLYIYSALYYATDLGTNLRRAQYIFALIYIALIFVVMRIYAISQVIPPYCLIFLCLTAYRVHSICLLRLFNDPIAMLLLYFSVWLMLNDKWTTASVFFSVAVSVKMNILLFAPGLLVLLIAACGYRRTFEKLLICAIIQLLIGAPFLLNNPIGYISGAFNFGRVFFHKWTVNWRFVPEDIFIDKRLHIALLAAHLFILVAFAFSTWFRQKGGLRLMLTQRSGRTVLDKRDILFVLFTSNFIGMMFSRSLHYQFYVWYFHTLPFLIWSITTWSLIMRLSVIGLIELSWNTYPSTSWSSLSLHICHVLILHGLWRQQGSKVLTAMKKTE